MAYDKEMDIRRVFRVTVQVSVAEKQRLSIIARSKNMTVSDYVRYVAIYKEWDKLFAEEE